MLSNPLMILTSALTFLAPMLPVADAESATVVSLSEPGAAEVGPDEFAKEPAEPLNAECLEIDQTRTYEGDLFGGKGDDHYPLNGKTITRAELQVDTTLHARAQITKQDSTEVVVHWWYDAFSSVTYTLKVWVEC